jgi:hypothetical protein
MDLPGRWLELTAFGCRHARGPRFGRATPADAARFVRAKYEQDQVEAVHAA